MLIDRLRTSAVLIAVVSSLLLLDGYFSAPSAEGLWLLPLLLYFSLGTAWDITLMVRDSGRDASRVNSLVGTALVVLFATVPIFWSWFGTYPPNCPIGRLGWIVVGSLVAMFTIMICEMKRFDGNTQDSIERSFAGGFMIAYVGMPFALMVAMRSMGQGNWGLAALLTTIAVTKSADAGAYFAGKSFGKHKLVPRLSPGKTWQGLAGGVLTATVVAFVCLQWFFPLISQGALGPVAKASIPGVNHPMIGALLLGPLLAIAGLVGDLAESLVKRGSGAKDSGNWLPGLGGVWDVTDSLIAAVLPAFLCFSAGVGL